MTDQNPKLEKGDINIKTVATIMIGVVVFVGWFYRSVITPIQQVQLAVTQIQVTLSEQSASYKNLDSRLNVVENKLNINK